MMSPGSADRTVVDTKQIYVLAGPEEKRNIRFTLRDMLQTASLAVSARGRFLTCRDPQTRARKQLLSNHCRPIHWLVGLDARETPPDTICSYDGQRAIIWKEISSRLEIIHIIELNLVTEVYFVQRHLVLTAEGTTTVALEQEGYQARQDSRLLSIGDRVSALALSPTGTTLAAG